VHNLGDTQTYKTRSAPAPAPEADAQPPQPKLSPKPNGDVKATSPHAPAYVRCDGAAICPEHGVTSVFDGKTKQVWNIKLSESCTFGEYFHGVADTRALNTEPHRFWNFCGCP
jgi:hypothetical protein